MSHNKGHTIWLDDLPLKSRLVYIFPPDFFFTASQYTCWRKVYSRVSNSLDFACCVPCYKKKMCSFVPCIVYKLFISSKGLIRFRFNFSKEKAMAPHSSTLAWKIAWMEEPGGLPSMGSQRVGHDWATSLSLFTFMHWRRKRQRHEHWSGLLFPPPGDLPGTWTCVSCLAGGFFTAEPPGKPF